MTKELSTNKQSARELSVEERAQCETAMREWDTSILKRDGMSAFYAGYRAALAARELVQEGRERNADAAFEASEGVYGAPLAAREEPQAVVLNAAYEDRDALTRARDDLRDLAGRLKQLLLDERDPENPGSLAFQLRGAAREVEELSPIHRDLEAVEALHDFETRRAEGLLALARDRGIDEPSIAKAEANAVREAEELSVEERGRMDRARAEHWKALSRAGDPDRRFNATEADFNAGYRAALAAREERGHLDLLRRIVKEAEFSAEAASTPDGWADTALGRVLGEAEALLLGEVEELPSDGQRPDALAETREVLTGAIQDLADAGRLSFKDSAAARDLSLNVREALVELRAKLACDGEIAVQKIESALERQEQPSGFKTVGAPEEPSPEQRTWDAHSC